MNHLLKNSYTVISGRCRYGISDKWPKIRKTITKDAKSWEDPINLLHCCKPLRLYTWWSFEEVKDSLVFSTSTPSHVFIICHSLVTLEMVGTLRYPTAVTLVKMSLETRFVSFSACSWLFQLVQLCISWESKLELKRGNHVGIFISSCRSPPLSKEPKTSSCYIAVVNAQQSKSEPWKQ